MVKQGLRVLGVLAVGVTLLCEAVLTGGCRRGDDPATVASTPRGSSTRRPSGRTDRMAYPDVDLSELLTEVPEYQGQGRDLFAFGPERREAPAPPTPSTATTTTPPAVDPSRTRTAPPPPVNLKFAGFIEKNQPGGESRKYAVLLSGEEILTGAVGDLVGNRYKIVEIGLESVTIAVEGYPATQKIPLRTN